ncbi:hypothetical protein JAAARDRAFT_176412 [Jaapia argillacea MUCL 33604]|uniref:Autophagy-related protein 11 n=1 Tax=Jaapia argillacea MUCL 33604 TaxID=933084 RepID=A0A067PUS1_9AGAM|nr:hypothetical protein JAAARDRAFT_176412 [Jaapia argillacea MUCL 33604]
MLQICRAEDGELFQVNASLRDIERTGSLERFLHQETGVEEDAVLAYLSDGRRLRNENVRELAGAQDQSIFVFNKYYLDVPLDEVLDTLRVQPPLQPPVEDTITATPPFRPSQLAASYLRTAHTHQEHVAHTLLTLRYQHEALRIASSSLDLNVLAIADAFEGISSTARKELDKQTSLLAGLEADLEIIKSVKIHAEFMSPIVRKAIESGDRARTLGDYVSNTKMRTVAETCARTHDDLQARFRQAEEAMTRLNEGADSVRGLVSDASLLEDAEACARRAQELSDKIAATVASLETATSDGLIPELRQLDAALRNEVVFITDAKNVNTERCISALRQISNLNNDLVQLPPALTSLSASFRVKTSFSHIQRLHNMLYAYGATLVEIVRRKEFARFFLQRASSILEVMAKVSTSERKRRQIYRGEIHGQLPFECRGMDDEVPAIDFTPTGRTESPYSFERADIDEFLHSLADIEQLARDSNDAVVLGTLRDVRMSLEKLVSRMDGLETSFDRIAERSLLSASRLSASRGRASQFDDQAYYELAEQLRVAKQAKADQEIQRQEERHRFQAEIERLRAALQDADSTAEQADRLERDLHQARAQIESEVAARKVMEQRHNDMLSDVESQRQQLARALADATDQTRQAEVLRQELAQMKSEYTEIKDVENRHAANVSKLLEDQAANLRKLEEARARGENLEAQIQAARQESERVRVTLEEADKEKERLLRAQASEHDRIMRDCIAEADGDRAVLEHQFLEVKARLDDAERQLKDSRAQVDMTRADARGLREEVQRLEHALREATHVEQVLRGDLRTGRSSQSDYEHRLEESSRLVAQILDVAIGFRASHVKAMSTAQAVSTHPRLSTNLADSVFSHSGVRPNIGNNHADEPSPIDPSDPAGALEQLRAFDHDQFLEVIAKTGSTIRKWQKQCKEYRERAKGKISFRNFAKGDLALFLPTRNSVSKPWAAFNVSFPHYFLNATGHLAEQLKTREWIVARITSIIERVVDHHDPASNPYGLGDGVKYYILEVEDWTQPSHSTKRKTSGGKKVTSDGEGTSPTSPAALQPGPPPAESEESFEATRPPGSHLFPTRNRTQSSPTAGPSSLSRLLAQAPPEISQIQTHLETIPASRDRTPSPTTSHLPPPSPTLGAGSQGNVPTAPSPLRPGSRASRVSASSKFSSGRIPLPPLGSSSSGSSGTTKAAPTTALSGAPGVSTTVPSPGSGEGLLPNSESVASTSTPSPEGSPSEGMSNIVMHQHRRRTASYHIPRTSPLATTSTLAAPPTTSNGDGAASRSGSGGVGETTASAAGTLATLANSWGVSFGRKKKAELSVRSPLAAVADDVATAPSGRQGRRDSSASDMLKRL